jgi:hypothetical protein
MKVIYLCFVTLFATPFAFANFYIPNAKLAGETVSVRLAQGSAVVTAVFEYESWQTRDSKVVYFPLFAEEGQNAMSVLARSSLELVIDGKKVGIPTPCEDPRGIKSDPKTANIFWFSANLDDLFNDATEGPVEIHDPFIIRARYVQPLVHGSFFYLPVIAGYAEVLPHRLWKYQMFARSTSRQIKVVSKATDYESLESDIVLYLKDREIIELQ